MRKNIENYNRGGIISKENKYIIKFKNSRAYLKSLNDGYKYTFDIDDALKLELKEAGKIKSKGDFEIVEYGIEKYDAAKERYKVFVKVISLQKNSGIIQEDLKNYDKSDKKSFFLELQNKYPNNKLLAEITRVNNLIDNQNEDKKEIYDYDLKSQIEILETSFENRYINDNSIEKEEQEETL